MSDEFAYKDERDDIRGLKYSLKPNTFKIKCGATTLVVTMNDGNFVTSGEVKHLTMKVVNNIKAFGNQGYQVKLELINLGNYKCTSPCKEVYAPCWTLLTTMAISEEVRFELTAGDSKESIDTILIKLTIPTRGREYYIPLKFVRR